MQAKTSFYFTASLTQHNVRPNPYLIDDQIILLKRESSKELAKYGSGKRMLQISLSIYSQRHLSSETVSKTMLLHKLRSL